jgi:DNA polymerase-3 subunit delta'
MVFEDIVGQSNAIKVIKNSLLNNRAGHAYIFCGPDGVGKSLAASIFAAALNCKEAEGNPCNLCTSCIKAKSGNHPDIIDFKTERTIIRVDDIRGLQKDMQKKPYESENNIYIIHEGDKMNEEAQNCLLKTLEEPPLYVTIIILAKNEHYFLSTITSRCQIVKFTRAPEKEIEDYLKKNMGVLDYEARYAASFSEGILQRAKDYLSNDEFKESRNNIINMCARIKSIDKAGALSYLNYFMDNKSKIDYILTVMVSFYRDIMIYKETKDNKYITNIDKVDIINRESLKYTYTNLYNIISVLKQTSDNLKYNINFQLSMELMLLKLQEG